MNHLWGAVVCGTVLAICCAVPAHGQAHSDFHVHGEEGDDDSPFTGIPLGDDFDLSTPSSASREPTVWRFPRPTLDPETGLWHWRNLTVNSSRVVLWDPLEEDPFEGSGGAWAATRDPRFHGGWGWSPSTNLVGIPGDRGLMVKNALQHFAISREIPGGLCPRGRPLVIQYEVQYNTMLDCGSAYIKLLPETVEPEKLSMESEYVLLFGPDKCGNEDGVMLTLRHPLKDSGAEGDPLDGAPAEPSPLRWVEFGLLRPPRIAMDLRTHVYTLVLHPESNRFEIFVDLSRRRKGILGKSDFTVEAKQRKPAAPSQETNGLSCGTEQEGCASAEPIAHPPPEDQTLPVEPRVPHPANLTCMHRLAIEGWSVQADILFDNFFLGHDVEAAFEYARATWIPRYNAELTKDPERLGYEGPYREPGPVRAAVVELLEDFPVPFLIVCTFMVMGMITFTCICCFEQVTDDDLIEAVQASRETQRMRDRMFMRPREDFYYPTDTVGVQRDPTLHLSRRKPPGAQQGGAEAKKKK
eukprot:RCo045718